MPRITRSFLLRYGGAVLGVAVAIEARWLINGLVGDRAPYTTFYLATAVTAMVAGLGPGMVALVLGAASAIYFFMTPQFHFGLATPNQITGLVLYLFNNLVVILLAEARSKASRRAIQGQEALLREIAGRERIEAALRESEVRFRAFIDNSPAIHVIKDEAGRYTYGNAVWASQFDRPASELIGRTDSEIWPADTAELFRASDEKAMTRNATIEVMEEVAGRFWMSLKFPLVHGGNKYVGAIILDTTERVEAVQALRRSEDQFRALADSMPQIVWAARPDGTLDYYNRKWFEYTGLDDERSFPEGGWREGWAGILHPDDLRKGFETWDRSVETGHAYEIEYRLKERQDGVYRWHLGRALPVRGQDGAIVRWYGTCTDIDDQKRAEEAAEAANLAKDRFIAVLSHELRTPLTPVLLEVSSILDREEVEAEIRPVLEMVRRNVALEARLIDDLLDLTRINEGKMAFHPEPSDVHALIRQALQICRSEFLDADIRVDFELAALDHFVTADPARLQQVFWNLIKNSVKFTPPGGTLTLRSRNEGRPDEPSRLLVEVIDTGIGIAAEFLPRVFDAFEQGENSYKTRKYGGLGLGLAISRSVVEAHGGSLTALSEGANRGATLRLELVTTHAPIPAVVANGPVPSPTAHLGTMRILLVEDDPSTRQVLSRFLSRLGHHVTTADCVSAAIEAFDANTDRLDLILSDIGLPDGTGLDLMRNLKPRTSIPAIALTGFGTEEDILKGRDAGFSLHLTKPIEPHVLEDAIRRVGTVGA